MQSDPASSAAEVKLSPPFSKTDKKREFEQSQPENWSNRKTVADRQTILCQGLYAACRG